MSFTNLLFLFVFLPISVIVYYLFRGKARKYVLLLVSILFYAINCFEYLYALIALMVLIVILARMSAKITSTSAKRVLLAVGVLLSLVPLVLVKGSGIIGLDLDEFPLGISYFTFKAVSYLVDAYRGTIILEGSVINDFVYLSMFTHIQSGPISRFGEMEYVEGKLFGNGERQKLFVDGIYRFMIGFSKKILLADTIGRIVTEVFETAYIDFMPAFAWLGVICGGLQLYYDFSGYSDMAIGLTNVFGYRCEENFIYPACTKSFSEFWRRWHVSLGNWFRDYIYFPLGGSRCKTQFRNYLNIFIVWLATGLWHGFGTNYIFWGLLWFAIITIEKLTKINKYFVNPVMKTVYRILILLFFSVSIVFFKSNGVMDGLQIISRMFVPGTRELTNTRTLFLIKDNLFYLLFGIIFMMPIVPAIEKMCCEKCKKQVFDVIYGVIVGFMFIWALSFVVAGQNNPFAYANF